MQRPPPMLSLDHSPSSSPSPSPSETGSASSEHIVFDEPEGLEGLAESGVDESPPDGGPGVDDGSAPGTLTPDQFAAGLAAALRLAGQITRLETLTGSPDRPDFPPAVEAIYASAGEIPWLNWLIEPGNVWVARIIAIGAFSVPVAVGCAAELRQRQALAEAAAAAADLEADRSAAASVDD